MKAKEKSNKKSTLRKKVNDSVFENFKFYNPADSIKVVAELVKRLDDHESMLRYRAKNGTDTSAEINAIKKLRIELEMAIQIITGKFNEVFKLEYEITKKYSPMILRDKDINYYNKLINEKYNSHNSSVDFFNTHELDLVEEETKVLKSNYEILLTDISISDLFGLLIEHGFVSKQSRHQSFEKLFRLEAISKSERIIWIEKFKGKSNMRTLAKLVTNIATAKYKGLHGSKTLGYFIQHYFVVPNSEIKTKSVDIIVHNVLSEVDKPFINPREDTIEELTKRATEN